jgi:NodT family efflux transporter outer membrane factor (OMF) lipoprotein
LRSGLDATANRLAVLAGQNPGELHELLAAPRPIPVTPPAVAVGMPAEALRRRPDIRRAERELAAQTARVGVAVSDLYPRFRLVGSIGLESLETSDFFSSSSQLWSFGPGVTWNIFNAGAVRNNITVQSELQEQYVLAYEAAVLGALEEVENSLTTYAEEHVRREQLSNAVDSAQRAKLLAEDRYKAGLVDFINVLNAQRSLLSFQDQLVQSNSAVTSNLIKIYKALGGGWNAIQSLRSENITRHPHK